VAGVGLTQDRLREGAGREGARTVETDLEGAVVALKDLFGQSGKALCPQGRISRRFVRMAIDGVQPPKPFQAEYEGSIPFTRSKRFRWLSPSFLVSF
jgi:hypothetical protein